jgi:hypothetical protein
MAEDPKIQWTRPEGCLCEYVLRGPTWGGNGQDRLTRQDKPECPFHGDTATKIEAAVSAVMEVARTIPGMDDVTAANLRRIFRLALPALTGVAAPSNPPAGPGPV